MGAHLNFTGKKEPTTFHKANPKGFETQGQETQEHVQIACVLQQNTSTVLQIDYVT